MTKVLDIDAMLKHVGDFGKFQIILMLFFSLINILSAFHYFGQTFISVVPEYKCALSGYKENVVNDQCELIVTENNSQYSLPCPDGWEFNKNITFGYTGIIEDLKWVCENDWKPALGQSIFFIGSVAGSLTLGVLADVIGRLHVLVIANMLACIGNIATILSTNVLIFAISRFAAGCATDSNFVMMYIIVMEYIRPSLRTMGLNLCIGLFYCLSCTAIPWVAVFLGNWRYFLIFISLPHLLVFCFYLTVPESAQWLASKGRTEDAIDCFRKIARINGIHMEDWAVEGLRTYCRNHVAEEAQHENLLGLLRTPKLRKKTLILIFKSMVMTLCYDAISRDVNGLEYSPFVVFSITSLTILPACLFILAVQDKIGRKALASSSLLLSGIFAAASGVMRALLNNPDPLTILILAIIARLGINVAYNSGAQYAVELIPTVVRGQGVSVIHVTGYAASFFSPQILYLASYWLPGPSIVLGILLVLGSLACLFLPETLNKTLPVTLKDGEEFGEDESMFDFACWKTPTDSTVALHPSNTAEKSQDLEQ